MQVNNKKIQKIYMHSHTNFMSMKHTWLHARPVCFTIISKWYLHCTLMYMVMFVILHVTECMNL